MDNRQWGNPYYGGAMGMGMGCPPPLNIVHHKCYQLNTIHHSFHHRYNI